MPIANRPSLLSPSLSPVCTDFIKSAHDKKIPVTGPVRLPTRTLRITTRKTPCGEGRRSGQFSGIELRTNPTLSSNATLSTTSPIRLEDVGQISDENLQAHHRSEEHEQRHRQTSDLRRYLHERRLCCDHLQLDRSPSIHHVR